MTLSKTNGRTQLRLLRRTAHTASVKPTLSNPWWSKPTTTADKKSWLSSSSKDYSNSSGRPITSCTWDLMRYLSRLVHLPWLSSCLTLSQLMPSKRKCWAWMNQDCATCVTSTNGISATNLKKLRPISFGVWQGTACLHTCLLSNNCRFQDGTYF